MFLLSVYTEVYSDKSFTLPLLHQCMYDNPQALFTDITACPTTPLPTTVNINVMLVPLMIRN
jgi:hypothetical protein